MKTLNVKVNPANQLIAFVLFLLTFIIHLPPIVAQTPRSESSLVPESEAPRAHVLLLGTFHFRDAGLDDFKPQVEIDIMSPRRQAELEQLLQALEDFHPTKIAVEWPAKLQEALNSMYADYLSGNTELGLNEIYQVGFRLAKRLGHKQVWAIDAPARWYDQNMSTRGILRKAEELGQHGLIERGNRWIQQYQAYHGRVDTMKSELSLSEYLLYLNSSEHLRRSHAQYLVGQIEVGGKGDYTGADARTAWYNRNIRIFTNIQRMAEEPGDRLLVIIGAGHVPILKHLVESSPEFLLAEPADYLAGQ